MDATLRMKECDTMRILVVEDDRLLNNTLCYNLDAAGYAVDSALTKSVASNFLTKQDYDLIVLDVNLPDGNGFDFCREVKERRPDTAVIFLTANDMESDMLKGYELGAEDYVTKPFPMSVFQKKLSVVLGRLAKQSGGGDSYEDGALSINFSEMTAYSMMGTDLAIQKAKFVLAKLKKKNVSAIKRSELFQMCRGKFFKKTEEIFPTLELLEGHGYIRLEEPERQSVGRPADVKIIVNPAA